MSNQNHALRLEVTFLNSECPPIPENQFISDKHPDLCVLHTKDIWSAVCAAMSQVDNLFTLPSGVEIDPLDPGPWLDTMLGMVMTNIKQVYAQRFQKSRVSEYKIFVFLDEDTIETFIRERGQRARDELNAQEVRENNKILRYSFEITLSTNIPYKEHSYKEKASFAQYSQ